MVVYVEVPDKSRGKRKKKVHIEYQVAGYIPVEERLKARIGMTEIMPIPEDLRITILPAGGDLLPVFYKSLFILSKAHFSKRETCA